MVITSLDQDGKQQGQGKTAVVLISCHHVLIHSRYCWGNSKNLMQITKANKKKVKCITLALDLKKRNYNVESK